MMMTFRAPYFILAIAIFLLEVAIASGYIPGTFVRSSVGDILVTILIYCLIRSLTRASVVTALVVSLLISVTAECLQYIHLADRLALNKGSIFYIILGKRPG